MLLPVSFDEAKGKIPLVLRSNRLVTEQCQFGSPMTSLLHQMLESTYLRPLAGFVAEVADQVGTRMP